MRCRCRVIVVTMLPFRYRPANATGCVSKLRYRQAVLVTLATRHAISIVVTLSRRRIPEHADNNFCRHHQTPLLTAAVYLGNIANVSF